MARKPEPWFWKERRAWYVTIDGRRHRLAEGREARPQALKAFHALMAARGAGGEAPAATPRVDELANRFLAQGCQDLSPRTTWWYKRYLTSFCGSAGAYRADEIQPRHVLAWCDLQEWGPTSRFNAITAVKRLFSWGRKVGYLKSDPVADLEKPTPRRRKEILSGEQAEAVLDAIPDRHFRDLLTVSYDTGCRPSEVLAFEAKHLDADARCLVLQAKTSRVTGRDRVVHLPDRCLAICRRLAAEHPSGPMFRNTRGRPWTVNAVALRFRGLRRRLGLGPEATWESFRHLFITDALERGVPIATVAELVGHTSTAMISRHYSHLARRHQHLKDALGQVRPQGPVTPADDPTSEGR
jgi:integrase